jgi:hypothetical protein
VEELYLMLAQASSIFCLVSCLAFHVLPSKTLAADTPVTFDVPAIIAAEEDAPDSLDSPDTQLAAEKTIQIVVPVSTEIAVGAKEQIEAFRFDVYWNRNGFLVSDYGPRSETFSEIAGDVSVETSQEDNAAGGVHLQGGLKSTVSGNASVDVGMRESTRQKYSRRPQQEILVASGTSHRGTGAFFRFHRSSQELLEGGRELTLKFEVPAAWRAGVLRVDCLAAGSREVFRSWSEPYKHSRTFVVPVFLANDVQAKAAATDFAQAEQRLRLTWQNFRSKKPKPNFPPLATIFAPSPVRRDPELPAQWVHYLIQSGNDAYLEKYHARLPQTVASSAEQFVVARRSLMRMQQIK